MQSSRAGGRGLGARAWRKAARLRLPRILQPAVASSPHRRVVMDHAYLWPHFTPTAQPVQYGDDTLAMFTLSKMTGHGSTRIG